MPARLPPVDATGFIAWTSVIAYLKAMAFRFLLRLSALLALLLAPAGMLGSHAAMAMPHQAAASADHCPDKQSPADEERQQMADCAMACSAMPAAAQHLGGDDAVASALPKMTPAPSLKGSRPEADTPPPRRS
jgi:hypothetical protein